MSTAALDGFAIGETIAIRPGVVLPDWSLVPDPTGRCALAASMAVAGRRTRWAGLSAQEDQVWRAILTGFGRGETRVAPEADRSLLRSLADRDLIVLADEGAVAAAYPFSAAPTLHRVHLAGTRRSVHALCAIDALGLGGMLAQDSIVQSACPYCRQSITIGLDDGGRTLRSVRPVSTIVWSGIRYAGGCAATSGCMEKLFFCCEAHVRAWRGLGHGPDGFQLLPAVALQIGLALFVPMLRSLLPIAPSSPARMPGTRIL